MKKIFRLICALGCALAFLNALAFFNIVHAAAPNNDHPQTFVGPTLKGSVTNLATNTMAYSIAGEAGFKNVRVGGTLGWQLACNQFFKVSADYLSQNITYAFFSGNVNRWVNQSSIGAGYLYDFSQYQYHPQFNLNGYFSHAPNKNLSAVSGSYVNIAGTQNFINYRRIAGSNAGGISPGVSIAPWMGGRIGMDVNYDNVRYDKIYAPSQEAVGLGGTVKLSQDISDNVAVGLSAAVRKPFNNYEATVLWKNIAYQGMWDIGLFGDYTVGKHTLPNTYNAGVTVNFSVDCPTQSKCMSPARTDLHSFTATPAVYLPQVLAIADQRVDLINPPAPVVCSPVPTLIGTIPTLDDSVTTTFDASSVFSPGSGLTYSISVSPSPSPPGSVTINPTTGVITLVSGGVTESLTAVVTASNSCGSVTSNTFTIILND